MQYTPYSLKPIYRPKKLSIKTPYAIDCAKLNNSHQVREELISQMLAIDTHQRQMQRDKTTPDFSLRQTFREMIQSRRQLLQKISQRID
ncbi:Uncharacterised protein [BD1-7 clade bacterium]|uniref:Uncharacterized protein n=1 Tax=BD1-7 clade bacterium TaxID=2029982 RepID=A0A5S9N258_9GAMM|nr:Uncharacterised protein [BD1-7 clade bacterium]CAA0083748.1 Uncharacterised protein [BD1-7 clade bacterium]